MGSIVVTLTGERCGFYGEHYRDWREDVRQAQGGGFVAVREHWHFCPSFFFPVLPLRRFNWKRAGTEVFRFETIEEVQAHVQSCLKDMGATVHFLAAG